MQLSNLLWQRGRLALLVSTLAVSACEDRLIPPSLATEPTSSEPVFDMRSTGVAITRIRTSTKRKYLVDPSLSVGDLRYIDRSRRFIAPLPDEILGRPFIRTANADRSAAQRRNDLLSFDVNQPVVVYVADDDRAVRPAWLSAWTKTGLVVRDDDKPAKSYTLFRKRFPKGGITLGSNYWGDGGDMYTVFVVPAEGGEDGAGEDSQAPTPPATVHAVATSPTEVRLTWEESSDDVAVAGYQLRRDSTDLAVVTAPAFTDTTVSAGTTNRYEIVPFDAAGNRPAQGAEVIVSTPSGAPLHLMVTGLMAATNRKYTLDPSLSVGDVRYVDRPFKFIAPLPSAIIGHPFIQTANADRGALPQAAALLSFTVNQDVLVYVADDDRQVRPAWLLRWTDTGLDVHDDDKPAKKYSLFMKRFPKGDITLGSNYWGDGGNMYTVFIVPAGGLSKVVADAEAPTVPTALRITSSSIKHIDLNWDASSDNVGVVAYSVIRNGSVIGNPTSTSFSDTAFSGVGTYTYTVKARDAAGNLSGQANPVTVTAPSRRLPSRAPFRAFPGAEGHGALALTRCDRDDMETLRVTNLHDHGPGSLREAIASADDDDLSVIVFDVGGYITLRSRIEITASCLYIAGQTAPGGGVTVKAPDRQAFLLKGQPHDVVIRYLRIRNGTNQPGMNTISQSMIIGAGTDVIIDHVSMSWASDQLFSIYRYPDRQGWGPIHDITVQRTLFAEPLSGQPTCFGIKGETSVRGDANGIPQWYEIERISLHHNAALGCSHRAPMISAKDAEVVNNVIYNWNQGAVSTNGRQAYIDYVGNFFKTGPMNRTNVQYGYEFSHDFRGNQPGGNGGEPNAYVVIGNRGDVDGRAGPGFYLAGNVGPHNPIGVLDNWAMTSKYKSNGKRYPESNYQSIVYPQRGLMPISVAGVSLRRATRLPQPKVPVHVQSAFEAWQSLIVNGDVGANASLTCDGRFTPNADPVDQRVLRQALNGGGIASPTMLASERDVGGYPRLALGTPCADRDGDGMPDMFEKRYGLDPRDDEDAAEDMNANGYTNLEEYLNGTSPR